MQELQRLHRGACDRLAGPSGNLQAARELAAEQLRKMLPDLQRDLEDMLGQ